LSEEAVRGAPHNPGQGGWPTVRYFNKKTGMDGGNYEKKTDKSICDELGDDEFMTTYVDDYGGTSLCRIDEETGCSDKEKAFIKKMKDKTSEEQNTQFTRLMGMSESKMKPELKIWANKRMKILKQLLTGSDEL